jgi:hypothetical protein
MKTVAISGTKNKSIEQRKQIDIFNDYIALLSVILKKLINIFKNP